MSSNRSIRAAQFEAIIRSVPRLARGRIPRDNGPLRVRFVYEQLGAPMRYRVLHQMEQAHLSGLCVQDAPVGHTAELYAIEDCDLLYLYRLPLNSHIWPLLAAARLMDIPMLFDSDDLVWDERERDYNYLDAHHPPDVVAALLKTTRRTQAVMRRVDGFVFSTPFLAQLATEMFPQPAFVNENALGCEQVAAAEKAFAERQPSGEGVVIGYFCGTPGVHDEDFASIAPALAAVLAICPEVRLRLYGEVALPRSFGESFQQRIERHPAVTWEMLPHHIAQVDINIAPLVDNPQRRAKSAVKYLEAALLRVPTVAARLDPYQTVIMDGSTGMVAGTPREWADVLLQLVRDASLRRRLGEAAYVQVLAEHTTAVRAPRFATLLEAFHTAMHTNRGR